MRYKPALNEDDIKKLIEFNNLTNKELADMFGVSTSIIASYKSRLRRLGVSIPKYTYRTLSNIIN